nr:MAG TPA: hypothetical protein [Caudoviricetes sp.]DAZ42575.1 MAG TPA: hypothetical protein [Caudoviricetes sp.]
MSVSIGARSPSVKYATVAHRWIELSFDFNSE